MPCCTKSMGGSTFDAVGRQYAAVADAAECQPLLVPVADIASLLDVANAFFVDV